MASRESTSIRSSEIKFNPAVWTRFNPSATSEFGTITSFFGQDGAYKIIQDMVFFWTYAVINNQGTGFGALIFGMPVAIWLPGSAISFGQIFPVRVAFGGGSNISGMSYFVTGGSGNFEKLYARSYDGTTPVGSGNGIYISGVYQINAI
jgi:hypothetical protein